VGLKGQRGMLAITKKGHWGVLGIKEKVEIEIESYLGMEESDVFMNRLTKTICFW